MKIRGQSDFESRVADLGLLSLEHHRALEDLAETFTIVIVSGGISSKTFFHNSTPKPEGVERN